MQDIRFYLKTKYTNSRALIIGINKYEKATPLNYAVSDAEEVRSVLINEFGFPIENIKYLIDSNATKINILTAFNDFTKEAISIDDRIFIFFAGHGTTRSGVRGEIGFLVPFDADINNIATLIRWDDITNHSELIKAKHILFVMDACYGGLALTRSLHAGSARFLKDMMLRYSRQVLTAGKADEVVSDSGGTLPNHSVFTGHLIEGMRGNAKIEGGVLTANSLMAYVYNKVSRDKNSTQTPHYGHFDGDGDFIFFAPQLVDLENAENKEIDNLLIIPYFEEEFVKETSASKIKKVKSLLSNDDSKIELHDYIIEEVKRFLSLTVEDNFRAQIIGSENEYIGRISKYEELCNDIALFSACIAYWGKNYHMGILQKILSRSSDHLENRGGVTEWANLRCYPLILELYFSGIAAVEGKRYDSLIDIFYANMPITWDKQHQEESFLEYISKGIVDIDAEKTFNKLPGYDRLLTPRSDHLIKTIQPKIDEILFVGKNYEKSFDEFEILFSLAIIDLKLHRGEGLWGIPVGRFGWKENKRDNSPLSKLAEEANSLGLSWGPIKAGLFGGNVERLNSSIKELRQHVSSKRWQ